MHRVLFEMRDNVAALIAGVVLSAFWILYLRRRTFENRRVLAISCVGLAISSVLVGWAIYMFAHYKKVFLLGGESHFNWEHALTFFRGGYSLYPIRSYSVAMASAFAINIALINRRAALENINAQTAMNAAMATIIGTLVGGRLLFVITQWSDYADKPWSVLAFWEGGLVFYGGFIGSFVCVMFYMWVMRREKFLPLGDLFSPYAGFGLAIHRSMGCFMNGCCYGHPTTMPWGVRFPIDHPGTKFFGAEAYLHPTQLYETLNGLMIFAVLLWFRPRRKYYGQSTALLLMIYAVNRYIIELFRGDLLRGSVGEFSTSQFISFWTFAAGAALMAYAYIAKRPVWRPGASLASDADHSAAVTA